MHSAKPPTSTHSARGSFAGRCPQRSRAPSSVGRLPQTKPDGSRNRAGNAGTFAARFGCSRSLPAVRIPLIVEAEFVVSWRRKITPQLDFYPADPLGRQRLRSKNSRPALTIGTPS